ncbi:hypothetical protein FANTH_13043 [Fusarium anthophilum]|uniref:Xylanolytic transcriptional activator regulatory domain-containing protein n=1 Tax=Fusarium anthophilum TaxID=48485 RepID=A0A8H4YQ63_9HYPO|nr:hypothetical protein FANTH_13043 [Fusarium anthophilum]
MDSQKLERLVDLLESRLNSENPATQDLSPQSSDRPASDMDLMNTPTNSHPAYTPSSEGRNREAVGFANKSPSGTPDYNAEIGQTPMSCPEPFEHAQSWLCIPEPLAIELVHLFFDKIQPWLPLLHRPRFFATYIHSDASSFCDPCSLDNHDKLLIYGMLALAARHSTNAYFSNIPAPERGNGLLKEACSLYRKSRETEDLPNIKYLQGCVLLTNSLAVDGPCHRAWILTSVSVRMAYDLDLCNMDDVEEACSDPEEWTVMEERRRLFWAIWEIDTFLSTLARRPRAIDHRRMVVLLPVSDAAWFAQEPVESSLFAARPSEVWKCLMNSSNQDERAWFLIANYIMALTYETTTSTFDRQEDREEIVNAITCFSLLVMQRFSLGSHPGLFSVNNPAYHWILGLHLMINASRICVSAFNKDPQPNTSAYTQEFCRIMHHWHPETVVLGHPFLACILLLPQASLSTTPMGTTNTLSSNHEMTLLMLAQFGSVWKLGSLLTEVANLLSHPDTLSEEETVLAKRFLVFFPNLARRRRSLHQGIAQACGKAIVPNDGIPLEHPPAAMELLQQLHETTSELVNTHDFGPATLEDISNFQLDLFGDWSVGLPLDDVCNENQNFNYLQL